MPLPLAPVRAARVHRWTPNAQARRGPSTAARLRRLTPLPRDGFAVAGMDREGVKSSRVGLRTALPPTWERGMDDSEIETLKRDVSCAALLERQTPAWKLDYRQSTKRALKYRRNEGEVLIVNHDERGWWDPQSSAKGDVFLLVQHLEPGLNFGQVRQLLRRFIGVAPSFPAALRTSMSVGADRPLSERWDARPRLRRGSIAWGYLMGTRGLPASVLEAARTADVVREGYYGGAWFAHRDTGKVVHIEGRGPAFKGSLRGGTKALFCLPGRAGGLPPRLAVTEAPIDALSLAAIEGLRPDTLYVATGGGMGPGTIHAIECLLADRANLSDALLVSATDANKAGDRYATQHAAMAAAAGNPFARLKPTLGEDWNDVLTGRGV